MNVLGEHSVQDPTMRVESIWVLRAKVQSWGPELRAREFLRSREPGHLVV